MRYGVAAVGVLLVLLFGVRAADAPPKDEETAKLDKSVNDALTFLQGQQLGDGGWTAGFKGAGQANPAVTSLCVMAFLSAGNVPGEGRYGETVEKGIRWVLRASSRTASSPPEGPATRKCTSTASAR